MPETRHSFVCGTSSLSCPGLSLSWVFKAQGLYHLSGLSLASDILGTQSEGAHPGFSPRAATSECGSTHPWCFGAWIFDGHWKCFPTEQIPPRPQQRSDGHGVRRGSTGAGSCTPSQQSPLCSCPAAISTALLTKLDAPPRSERRGILVSPRLW